MARPLILGFTLLICALQIAFAADKKVVPQGPIPTPIVMAKKVFIANAGGDDPGLMEPLFNQGVDRAYNLFYDAMKNAGRYELAGSPTDADLLFEIRFTVQPGPPDKAFQLSGAAYDPQFRVEIRDPKANALLWAFTEHMEWAILQGNRNKNFDQAAGRIAADVLALAERAAGATSQAKPQPAN